MESNQEEAVFDSSASQELAVSRVKYEPEIHSVDPNTLLSHPVSLDVYQDQDEATVSADKNFIVAVRKHGGNLTPVLVWSKDRRTILSGDRRRTACKLLHLAVRVQYVNPGDVPGDVEQFIIDANQGARGTLDNFQKGRAAVQLREALKRRKDHFDAIEAAKQKPEAPALVAETEAIDNQRVSDLSADFESAASGDHTAADPVVPTAEVCGADSAHLEDRSAHLPENQADTGNPVTGIQEEPAVEGRYDTQFDEVIAERMNVPVSVVKAAAKTVNRIDELESQGKTDEAEDLKQKLNKSLHVTARTLPDRKRYEKGSAAAVKMFERILRGAIKTEVPNLLKVACANPAMRGEVIADTEALYAKVQKWMAEEKEAKKPRKSGESSQAQE